MSADASRPRRRIGATTQVTGATEQVGPRTLADMSPAARAATLTARRSGRFVAWARAWRAGLVPFDDAAAEIRLVLPAPGDPRGLPGPGPFTGAALVTGEAVVAGQLGLVPEVRSHTSGSGDAFETVLWRVYGLPDAARTCDEPTAAEAEAELSAALADATRALAKLDVAQWRPELAGALAALRRPDNGTDLPPGYDPRARRTGRCGDRLRGAPARRGAAAAPGGVPARAGRGLQRAPALGARSRPRGRPPTPTPATAGTGTGSHPLAR